MRVQIVDVHAELQSGVTYGGVDVFITRNRNRVVGFNNFLARLSVYQRPAFLQFGDVFFVGISFCFYFVQLFPVHRIGAGCGYVSVSHVRDFLLACVNAFGSDRRAFFDGKTVLVDRYVLARFERVAAYAGQACELFVQFEFIAYFFVTVHDVTDNKVFLVFSYGDFRTVDGVFFTAIVIRAFADSDIVTCYHSSMLFRRFCRILRYRFQLIFCRCAAGDNIVSIPCRIGESCDLSSAFRAINSDISSFDFISQAYFVVGRLSVFCDVFDFDAASVFVTCNGHFIRVDIVLNGFPGNEIAVVSSADRSVFRDVYHIFRRLIILFFRGNGNLAVFCRFYGCLAFFDFRFQTGNSFVFGNIDLFSVNTVCNGRAISCYGESCAGCIKGDGIIVIIDRFAGFFRVFVRGRLQNPRVHLRFDGGAIVNLAIDLLVQLGFVHAERQAVIVDGGVDVVITRDRNRIFCLYSFRAYGFIGIL